MSTETKHLRDHRAARAGRWIMWGATGTTGGICLSLTAAQDVAGMVTLLGLASALIGLHRFGRSGPDAERVKSRS